MPGLYPRLWRYCLFLCGRRDRADDLAQAVCMRAIEKSDAYKAGSHLDRWLFRIAQRTWLNEVRADAVRTGGGLVALELVDLADGRASTETNILARQVLGEIQALPEAQRITVLLVYIEGLTYKEASDLLEIPIGTVMSRLAAARKKISTRLPEQGTGT